MYVLFVVSVLLAFYLGKLYGQKVQDKIHREASGLKGAVARVESVLREKM